MPTTDELALPFPDLDGSDPADVPQDLSDLVERLETILAAGHVALWSTGDFKVSAKTTTHGRWLLCDGSEKTAAEIVTACGLDSGDANALATLLGTGGSSAYGTAATGKVRLPDARGRAIMVAGAGAGLTSRALGASGGAEGVTLSAAESGVKTHSHSVSDPGHTHTATQAAHTHSVTDGGHTHGATQAAHAHSFTGALATADPAITVSTVNDHSHVFGGESAGNTRTDTGTGQRITSLTDAATGGVDRDTSLAGGHTHTADQPAHTHGLGTLALANATPVITVGSATTGISLGNATPAITVNSGSTGLSVAAKTGEAATDAHNNMPPYLAIGHLFIRV